jgi:hypothetical protein
VSPGLFNARERGLSFHILPDGIVEDTGGEKPHARVKAEQRKKKPFSQALFFVSLLAIDVNIANVDTQLLAFLLGRTLCRAQCVSPPSRWRRGVLTIKRQYADTIEAEVERARSPMLRRAPLWGRLMMHQSHFWRCSPDPRGL